MEIEEEIERLKNQVDFLKITLSVVASKQKTMNCILYELLSELPEEKATECYTKYVDFLEHYYQTELSQFDKYLLSEHSNIDLKAQRDKAINDFLLMKKDPFYHQG